MQRSSIRPVISLLILLFTSSSATAQDTDPIRRSVEDFVRIQTRGLPGEVGFTIGPLSASAQKPPCPRPDVSLPKGARLWGRTSVLVECNGSTRWSQYVSVHVRVVGDYLVAGKALTGGQTLGESDFVRQKGDLTELPAGIITDPSQAVGRSLAMPVAAGMPLRSDLMKQVSAVQQGQMVRVVSRGQGFQVASEGQALNNAAEGQVVKVRLPNGQVVSGLARAGGQVDVGY